MAEKLDNMNLVSTFTARNTGQIYLSSLSLIIFLSESLISKPWHNNRFLQLITEQNKIYEFATY